MTDILSSRKKAPEIVEIQEFEKNLTKYQRHFRKLSTIHQQFC